MTAGPLTRGLQAGVGTDEKSTHFVHTLYTLCKGIRYYVREFGRGFQRQKAFNLGKNRHLRERNGMSFLLFGTKRSRVQISPLRPLIHKGFRGFCRSEKPQKSSEVHTLYTLCTKKDPGELLTLPGRNPKKGLLFHEGSQQVANAVCCFLFHLSGNAAVNVHRKGRRVMA